METRPCPPCQEGDLVRLHSGGPIMSLQEVVGEHAVCMWFDAEGKLQERRFLLASLQNVNENQRLVP